MPPAPAEDNRVISFATEAAWNTAKWDVMGAQVTKYQGNPYNDFNVSVGSLFERLRQPGGSSVLLPGTFEGDLRNVREMVAASMTPATTSSLSACHDLMLKSHVLTDLEILAEAQSSQGPERQQALLSLDRRLEVVGSYVSDKQYLLGIRRAAMELMR